MENMTLESNKVFNHRNRKIPLKTKTKKKRVEFLCHIFFSLALKSRQFPHRGRRNFRQRDIADRMTWTKHINNEEVLTKI